MNSRKWIEIILIILVAASCNIYIGILLHHSQPVRVVAPNREPIAILKPTAPPKQKTLVDDTRRVFRVPQPLQGKTIAQGNLSGAPQPVIALTLDDGYGSKNTRQILEILKREQVKATFFGIGKMVKN